MPVISFSDFVAGALIKASEMNTKLNLIKNLLNGNLDYDNIKDNGVTGDKMAATGTSTKVFHNGGGIALVDAGGFYTTKQVEAALQQVGAVVGTGGSLVSSTIPVLKNCGVVYHASDPTQCSVVVPANTATKALIIDIAANLNSAAGGSGAYLHVKLNTVDLQATNDYFKMGIMYAPGVPQFGVKWGSIILDTNTLATFDKTIQNTISLTAVQGGGTVTHITLSVSAI